MAKTMFVDFRAVKASVSMERVLDHYDLTQHFKRGNDSLSGPCPIHKGKNPTQFRVSLSKNCWNCFSDCKCGGNVLDFVAKMENINVHNAALQLAEWFDLDVGKPDDEEKAPPVRERKPNPPPASRSTHVPKERGTKDTSPREATAQAEEIGCNKPLGFALKELDAAHPYLTERGVARETVAEFGLGFCAKGSMSGRLVIPIHNGAGQLLAYAGRWPGEPPKDQPKYKQPAGFKKSAELFNLHRALKEPAEQPLILVEGFFDVMKLWQTGQRKVVALMGSFLSPAQEELILRHTSARSSILLMFDEDDAGRLCREQVMLRLCTKVFMKVFPFSREGQQPEHLTAEELQPITG